MAIGLKPSEEGAMVEKQNIWRQREGEKNLKNHLPGKRN